MKRLALVAMLALPIWIAAHQARSAQGGTYVILGTGNSSCGMWTKDRAEHGWSALIEYAWVLGFLTAYNLFGPGTTGNISKGTDPEGLAAWIDSYCAQHPLDDIATAAVKLIDKLRKRGAQ